MGKSIKINGKPCNAEYIVDYVLNENPKSLNEDNKEFIDAWLASMTTYQHAVDKLRQYDNIINQEGKTMLDMYHEKIISFYFFQEVKFNNESEATTYLNNTFKR